MLDEADEIATDYDARIRGAREDANLSRDELAHDLNEKASLIAKLERSEVLPSDDVQRKLERKLDITLADDTDIEDTEIEETEWSASDDDEMTIGDVADQKPDAMSLQD